MALVLKKYVKQIPKFLSLVKICLIFYVLPKHFAKNCRCYPVEGDFLNFWGCVSFYLLCKSIPDLESVKSFACRAYVLCVLAYLARFHAWRAPMLTCLHACRACLLTCLTYWRAYLLASLICLFFLFALHLNNKKFVEFIEKLVCVCYIGHTFTYANCLFIDVNFKKIHFEISLKEPVKSAPLKWYAAILKKYHFSYSYYIKPFKLFFLIWLYFVLTIDSQFIYLFALTSYIDS